ncbi:hypothetical protein O1611_g9029 [Lasiodiplodia mahajangana]|uniref:Uncharacterized protein n=1 Tax=Lasiodiplodia mahajangana TaxID=1108764 RepID=A0ACC2JAU4_9PEZI|nr:hypothetical protein O1611_g9029 [Lasiodiplodia mahajangana]
MARQLSMRSLACAILTTAGALVTASDDCYEEASPNLLTNPSWEDGLTGWTYIYPHSTSTAQQSDGDYSLMSTTVYPYQLVTQTVGDLVVGTAYEFSVDFNIIVSNLAITETCTMYLYHDSLTTTNLVSWKNNAYNMSPKGWQTLSGTYTATTTSVLFGIYTACSPYRLSQIAIYLDNAVLRGPSTQVCIPMATSEPTVAPTASQSTPVSTSESTPTPSESSSSAPASSSSASPSSSPTPTPSAGPSSVPPSSYSALPSSSYSVSPSSYSVSSFAASSTPANSYPVPPSSNPTPTPSSASANSYPAPPSSYPAPSSPVSSAPPSGSSSVPVGSYPVPPSSYPASSYPTPSNTPSVMPSLGPSVSPSSGPSSNPSAGPSYNPGGSLPVPPSSYAASSYPAPSNTPSSQPVASPSSAPTSSYPSYPSSYAHSSFPYPTPTRRPCMSKRRRLAMQQKEVRSD